MALAATPCPATTFRPRVVNHLLTGDADCGRRPCARSARTSTSSPIESFMDELAADAGARPDRVPARAPVRPARPGGAGGGAGGVELGRARADSVGHGIGYARYKNTSAYCAVVAEVEATERGARSPADDRRRRRPGDQPRRRRNQIEGGAIQATSWTVRSASGSTGPSRATPGRPIRSCGSPRCPPSTSISWRATATRRWGSASPPRARRRRRSRTRIYDAIGVRVRRFR